MFWIEALVKIVIVVLSLVGMATVLLWAERKQSAMMQDRIGPNRANLRLFGVDFRLAGLVHSVADGIKLIFKEDWAPPRRDRLLYALAPLVAFVPPLLVMAVVPFGPTWFPGHMREMFDPAWAEQPGVRSIPFQIAHLDMGVLFVFAAGGMGVVGAALAGWSSDNKFSMMGGLRAASQMISYEVTMGLAIVGVLMVYSTVRLDQAVTWQSTHAWGILVQPLAFVLFLTAAIAESKRIPFDLPEGESEVVGGYFTEYAGLKFGMFASGELVEVVTSSAVMVTLFFGGWQFPFVQSRGFELFLAPGTPVSAGTVQALQEAGRLVPGFAPEGTATCAQVLQHAGMGLHHLGWNLAWHWSWWVVVVLSVLTFVTKVLLLVFLQLQIRWTLPRFRYDQIMKLGWRLLLPASLFNILATGIVLLFVQGS